MLHKSEKYFKCLVLHYIVKFTYIYILISYPHNWVGPILSTIPMSLIPIAPTHSVQPGLDFFFFSIQESVREIRSKILMLINNTITQKLVRNLKVQIMLRRTKHFLQFIVHSTSG